jgi:23S rRNA pseudouridine2605 synthase
MARKKRLETEEAKVGDKPTTELEDPIGKVTDGEAATSIEAEPEAKIESAEDATESLIKAEIEDQEKADVGEHKEEPELKLPPRPPAKLERLQKILAQAGVASRRKAEEMIEQGRVQLNGKVVTELGTKADSGRDHIRVDGKLLQSAERQRYFVLNKPKGFVTTVKDPEGRPTVMQFFDKMRERLYPVGRLDYMSEGLLLVTNDGELANKLTRASAGVEKTYLVKVAGKPTEAELDILRAGVAIEKGKPGSDKVRTSPARIRQVRQGDNPWYEVVLIEGRNRELRKMFEEIGHFVEKIRRVGYGPLVLDQEPGHLRELDAQELDLLRKAADGKLRTPKAKEIRRRNIIDSLPPEKPAFKPRGPKPAAGPKDYRPKKSFGTDGPVRSGSGPAKFGTGPVRFGQRRPTDSPTSKPAWKRDDRAQGPTGRTPARFASGPAREGRAGEGRHGAAKSFGDRPSAGRTFGGKPAAGRTFGAKPGGKPFEGKPATGRSFPAKPAWKKPERQEWPQYKRPPAPGPETARRLAPRPIDEAGPEKRSGLHIEPIHETPRTRTDRPDFKGSGRAQFGRSEQGRSGAGRSSSPRPFRSEGGLSRPSSTSSGKPRAGGPRPSSKPGRDGGRPFGAGAGRSGPRTGRDLRPGGDSRRGEGSAEFRPRGEDSRPERKTGPGWKPKPSFGGKSKTSSGRSSQKPSAFSKSTYKGKPGGSGTKRTGPRPGGKKRG